MINSFKALVADRSVNSLKNISEEQLRGVMGLLSQAKRPYIRLLYEYGNGIVIWWSDEKFVQERKIFIKKIGSQYYITKLHAKKEDVLFSNIELFFQFQEFEKYQAKSLSPNIIIKELETKIFKFSLEKAGSYLSLFKDGDDEVFVHVVDNYHSENFRFSDIDSIAKAISVKFNGKNFKGTHKRKIYYIESSYPIGKLTKRHFKESSFITVKKDSE